MMLRKIIFIFVIVSITSSSIFLVPTVSGIKLAINPDADSDFNLITEFTWAVTRYDESYNYSLNFGKIEYTEPSEGTVLIPANFLSPELCKVALEVYHEDKMDTLNALVRYLKTNMEHIFPALIPFRNEWGPLFENISTSGVWRKETAHEMFILGERALFAKVIGDCYGLSSFSTAVLRLCGFSSDEVFNIWIANKEGLSGHVFNVVKVGDKWYGLDGSYGKLALLGLKNPLSEQKDLSRYILCAIENDRYYVHFGDPWGIRSGYFNNMNSTLLHNIMGDILQTIGKPQLGSESWDIDDFVNGSKSNPNMINVSLPYNVNNATGANIDQKAEMLATINYEFIRDHATYENETPNQYTRALYAYNLIDVNYPQVYANVAKYAAYTSRFGKVFNAPTPLKDILRTVIWIRFKIKTERIVNENQIAFSDLAYIVRKGSTLDQSVMAYGMLRNMKKDRDFWQPEDLFIVVTKDKGGYLAVKNSDGWIYLNFGLGKPILSTLNKDIYFVFNEKNKFILLQ